MVTTFTIIKPWLIFVSIVGDPFVVCATCSMFFCLCICSVFLFLQRVCICLCCEYLQCFCIWLCCVYLQHMCCQTDDDVFLSCSALSSLGRCTSVPVTGKMLWRGAACRGSGERRASGWSWCGCRRRGAGCHICWSERFAHAGTTAAQGREGRYRDAPETRGPDWPHEQCSWEETRDKTLEAWVWL